MPRDFETAPIFLRRSSERNKKKCIYDYLEITVIMLYCLNYIKINKNFVNFQMMTLRPSRLLATPIFKFF